MVNKFAPTCAQLWQQVEEGQDVRNALIEIRKLIREPEQKKKLAYALGGEFDPLTALLKDEDAKIRRSAALILGEMETEDILPALFEAYDNEETLFVKASYLKAMSKLDCSQYQEKLERYQAQCLAIPVTDDNRKHIKDQLSALDALLKKFGHRRGHIFVQTEPAPDVIVITNREHREVTADQILTGEKTLLRGGIRVHGGNLDELLAIRTYAELLFPIPEAKALSGDGRAVARKLLGFDLIRYLESLHDGSEPYRYRIELKGVKSLDEKNGFVKGVAQVLDTESHGTLVNSPDDYEIELRFLKRADGSYMPMLKFFTIPDHRFDYRRGVIATSIAPANAALTVRLAMPWLKEDAQVLDPMCGVGTMLIERAKAVPTGTMYGLDISKDAIEKARENTKHAGQTVNYIHRDFYDFKHDYLFDEVISDLPSLKETGEEVAQELTEELFNKLPELLKEGAAIVLYVTTGAIIRAWLRSDTRYSLEKTFMINEKNGTEVFVITYKG